MNLEKVELMKFLFVEDEAELLELYEMLLDDLNIDFKLAKNGVEALEYLHSDDYDFVFSDIRMPKMDGFELLGNIINDKIDLKSFVFITAHVDVTKEDVITKGATDILYKPLGHQTLKQYIEDLMT